MSAPSRRTKKPARRRRDETIIVTHAARSLGSALLGMLARHEQHRRLIAVDGQPLVTDLPQGAYLRIHLAKAGSWKRLVARVKNARSLFTFIHTALPETIDIDEETAGKRIVAEAKAVIAAAERLRAHKLVLVSSTDLYGALATNPAYLTEDMPAHGARSSPVLAALSKVEALFNAYAKKHTRTVVTTLRPCTILGTRVRDLKTAYFEQPAIPAAMGFDPLVQFVHESDVLRAVIEVIEKNERGVFNIVGDDVLPLSRAARMLGRPVIPLPTPILTTAAQVAEQVGLDVMPASYIPFLMHACIADGDKARHELGFVPVYTSQEALLSFTTRRPKR